MKLVRLSKIINQYYITWKSIMLQWMNLSPRQPKKQLWPPGILDSSSGKLLLANLPIGQLIFKLSMLIKNIVDFSTLMEENVCFLEQALLHDIISFESA